MDSSQLLGITTFTYLFSTILYVALWPLFLHYLLGSFKQPALVYAGWSRTKWALDMLH